MNKCLVILALLWLLDGCGRSTRPPLAGGSIERGRPRAVPSSGAGATRTVARTSPNGPAPPGVLEPQADPRDEPQAPEDEESTDAVAAPVAQRTDDEELRAEAQAAAEAALQAEAAEAAPEEPVLEATPEEDAATRRTELRIGVFHSATPTGQRHWQGAWSALRDHALEPYVNLVPRTYLTDREGEQKLLAAIRAHEFDLILGPTESGVFARAAKQESNLPIGRSSSR